MERRRGLDMGTNTHPQYDSMVETWRMLRDSYNGECAVKEKGSTYLPPTPGMVLDGLKANDPGLASFQNYIARAVYPDFFEVGISTLIGILNAKDTVIELPPQLDYLREKAMLNGQGLKAVIRKIHEEQLITGRLGLLADLPQIVDPANPETYIDIYKAEAILNWDNGSFNDGFDKLNMVLLDESGYKRNGNFAWEEVERYRALTLGALDSTTPMGIYSQQVADGTSFDSAQSTTPVLRGETLDEIPFVAIGPKDICIDPDRPPLLGLAQLCMIIYRGEADYRQSLFMQGQDTLVVVGGVRARSPNQEDELRVGAGARIDVEINGDAKYVGVSSTGLPEQRSAIVADRELAAVKTGQLLAPGKMSMESGEALKTRIAAQTATLTSIALAAAAGLEMLLKKIAKWHRADPAAVKVIPNLDFTNVAIAGQDIVQLVTAKNLGYPISYETLFAVGKERGLFKGTFEEEVVRIEKDPKLLTERAILLAAPQGNNPTQSAGGPQKTPDKSPVKSNKPKD